MKIFNTFTVFNKDPSFHRESATSFLFLFFTLASQLWSYHPCQPHWKNRHSSAVKICDSCGPVKKVPDVSFQETSVTELQLGVVPPTPNVEDRKEVHPLVFTKQRTLGLINCPINF